MLRNDQTVSLNALIADADSFVDRFVLPKSENEKEFLIRFAQADYVPELLFSSDVLDSAKMNPEALWKLANLKKMVRNDQTK